MAPIELLPVGDDLSARADARRLIIEYLTWLAGAAAQRYGLSFDVDAMVAGDLDDATKFRPPSGRLYIARRGGEAVGIGAVRRLSDSAAEVQRMYVPPQHRGAGVGRLIVERLLADARAIGYTELRLESLRFLTAAHALYRAVGFVEVAPYEGNSMRAYQNDESDAAAKRYRESAVFMLRRL